MAVDTKSRLRIRPLYEQLIDTALSDNNRNIKFPNRNATFLRNGFELSQLDGEGQRVMERQQQRAASENYKQSLIKQSAIDSGISASSLRTEVDYQNRQDRVDRMFKPPSESSDFQETEEHTVFAKDYDTNIERQQNMEFAARQEAEFRSKEKRDNMKKLVSDDLDKQGLALYNAHEENKRVIRVQLQRAAELQMEQLKQHRFDTQRDTENDAEKERAVRRQQLQVELEEARLKAYQYYNNLIVTAENDMATKRQQLQIHEKMIHEDKEVTAQLLLELRRRTNVASSSDIRNRATIILPDRASASAEPDPGPTSYQVYAIQGGTPTARKAEAARTKFGTQKNETKDIDFWYKMPLGFLADQAQAQGWRLQGEYYIQRSGAKVKQKNMTKLDWRREIFLLNIKDPLDP